MNLPSASPAASGLPAPLATKLLLPAGAIMALIVAMLTWNGFALKEAALEQAGLAAASSALLAVFGELDAEVPLEDVRALERVLSDSQREDQTYTYPGVGHAFFDNEQGNREYREAAERDLWQRIEKFFEGSMG